MDIIGYSTEGSRHLKLREYICKYFLLADHLFVSSVPSQVVTCQSLTSEPTALNVCDTLNSLHYILNNLSNLSSNLISFCFILQHALYSCQIAHTVYRYVADYWHLLNWIFPIERRFIGMGKHTFTLPKQEPDYNQNSWKWNIHTKCICYPFSTVLITPSRGPRTNSPYLKR